MPKPPALPSLKQLDNRAAAAPKAEKPAPVSRPDNPHYRPSRAGAENLTGYYAPAVKHQFREIALEKMRRDGGKVNIQDLMDEAFDDLFAKYGKPEIVKQTRRQALANAKAGREGQG